jgi:hypothetical protein
MANKLKAHKKKESRKNEPAAKPISLAPLSFGNALKGLVKVRPEKKSRA